MRTINLKIKNEVDLFDMQERYSGMFRMMFVYAEMLADKGFQEEVREKFNMDSWMYQSIRVEVEMKLAQIKTCNKNKRDHLEELKSELEKIEKQGEDKNCEKGKKWRRHKFYVIKKIAHLTASIDRDITFGGRALLQKITRLHNKKNSSRKQKEVAKFERDIEKATAEYHEKRILPITIIGEAPNNSNRKFNFDFTNKKVVFKPSKNVKIPIEFYASDGHMKTLNKLQLLIGEMAITVRLTADSLQIIYDEEKLNGFAFNEREYKRDRQQIKQGSDKKEFSSCKQKWHKEQDERMLVGKIPTRYMAVDLNPENVGVCVLQKTKAGFDILHKEVYELTNLNVALGKASHHKSTLKQNNKRDHEVKEIWTDIFGIVTHYRVANFVMEDLEFKEKSVNDNSKQANKKTKNLWHRVLTEDLIEKHCNSKGIKKILVNACYTSFVGNIKHAYYDPLNAAIEIGRRGMCAFEKGGFYPSISGSDVDTMSLFGLDVQGETPETWVQAFQLFKTAKLRYRRGLQQCKFVETNLLSHKSAVKRLRFYTK